MANGMKRSSGKGHEEEVTAAAERLDAAELEQIQRLTGEVVNKSSARAGTCIYRGEPECCDVVSSGLHREFQGIANEAFDIGQVERETARAARR